MWSTMYSLSDKNYTAVLMWFICEDHLVLWFAEDRCLTATGFVLMESTKPPNYVQWTIVTCGTLCYVGRKFVWHYIILNLLVGLLWKQFYHPLSKKLHIFHKVLYAILVYCNNEEHKKSPKCNFAPPGSEYNSGLNGITHSTSKFCLLSDDHVDLQLKEQKRPA